MKYLAIFFSSETEQHQCRVRASAFWIFVLEALDVSAIRSVSSHFWRGQNYIVLFWKYQGMKSSKLLFFKRIVGIRFIKFYILPILIQYLINLPTHMILKNLRHNVTIAKQSIRSLYPFEYTFYPQQYKYRDPRFEQFPVLQTLFPAEKQHIAFVLNSLQQLFSKGNTESAAKQYISPRLVNLVRDYRQYLNAQSTKMQFTLHKQTFNQSVGYLEYYGLRENLFMHQYIVERKDQKISLVEKEQLRQTAKKSEQDQLKQDIKDMEKDNSLGQKLKEKIFKDKNKKSEGVIKIWEFFQNSYRKSKEIKKFQPFILVNRIDGKMNVKFKGSSKIQQFSHLDFTTKWLYNVTSDQPESIRRSRKRILFDIQFWNRGCLIPVKDFASL